MRNFAIQYASTTTWHTTRALPVHKVTQYFRGRLANKGAGEEGKMHGKGRWQAEVEGKVG